MKFLSLQLAFANPIVRVIPNPSAPERTMLSAGESPSKLIFTLKDDNPDYLSSSPWFTECMQEVKVLHNIHVEVGEINGRCSVEYVMAEMKKDGNVEAVEEDFEVKVDDHEPNTDVSGGEVNAKFR